MCGARQDLLLSPPRLRLLQGGLQWLHHSFILVPPAKSLGESSSSVRLRYKAISPVLPARLQTWYNAKSRAMDRAGPRCGSCRKLCWELMTENSLVPTPVLGVRSDHCVGQWTDKQSLCTCAPWKFTRFHVYAGGVKG